MLKSFVKWLGNLQADNKYTIKPYGNEFWIFHNEVQSGEPLQQALDDSLEGEIIKEITILRDFQKQYEKDKVLGDLHFLGHENYKLMCDSQKRIDLMLGQYYKEVKT